jgi:hypothetical protein
LLAKISRKHACIVKTVGKGRFFLDFAQIV